MTQIDRAWGAGPSARYESLAERFRPTFARIRATALSRDLARTLPRDEIQWLREAGFPRLRVPESYGGFGVTLPELFNLLIELSEADSNVTNALRAHFGFTEDLLNARVASYRDAWLTRLGAGQTVGSGFSEAGDAKVGSFSTTLTREDDQWRVNGQKYYTTGSLFADWIHLGANDGNGELIGALVPTSAAGVDIIDDWDGFGQALTASGTVIFDNVALADDLIKPDGLRFPYSLGFFQLVHLATLAGIARAAASDVARLLGDRRRIYSHGNTDRAGTDPQLLQVAGRVRGAAYSAGAIVLKAAEGLQRAHEARLSGDEAREAEVVPLSEIEVSQSVTVVSTLVLDATTILFDALGASAAKRGQGLDRYWRNARTIASHNPRVYHDRNVGNFAVNGVNPLGQYRVGQA